MRLFLFASLSKDATLIASPEKNKTWEKTANDGVVTSAAAVSVSPAEVTI